ncbi:Uncharacterized conserved protein, contains HEPN domain [Microbacterium azadirachtae]|uniref:Uncharacterized conserved protein, contains HEPN domain n=1 Tax=Microbacterium azadirachtae TaxID=582680 RepID=A0A1I6IQ80_9MICO|nr:HepT-like ribonuclease domain-containing protein [Microbacterium azadirachtae]SFR68907.1 Uncharacterized conserved protein, contains HEPN domain [Microbacterium azadirachtae]
MTRAPRERLLDILASCEVIAEYLERSDTEDGLLFDALRMRLLKIGEAAKDLPTTLTDTEPAIPWSMIARQRDRLAHRYFDTAHAIVFEAARHEAPTVAQAVRRMLAAIAEE